MKKIYPVSNKAKEWARHLRSWGKRLANKSTRRIFKKEIKKVEENIIKKEKKDE